MVLPAFLSIPFNALYTEHHFMSFALSKSSWHHKICKQYVQHQCHHLSPTFRDSCELSVIFRVLNQKWNQLAFGFRVLLQKRNQLAFGLQSSKASWFRFHNYLCTSSPQSSNSFRTLISMLLYVSSCASFSVWKKSPMIRMNSIANQSMTQVLLLVYSTPLVFTVASIYISVWHTASHLLTGDLATMSINSEGHFVPDDNKSGNAFDSKKLKFLYQFMAWYWWYF